MPVNFVREWRHSTCVRDSGLRAENQRTSEGLPIEGPPPLNWCGREDLNLHTSLIRLRISGGSLLKAVLDARFVEAISITWLF